MKYLDKKSVNIGIYIAVGGGPQADLITVRGLKAIRVADVVLYDRLIDEALLAEVTGEKILVGKVPYQKCIDQMQINRIIGEKLLEGLTVLRLKGGDSLLFSRVQEEIEVARSVGAKVELIPGVTTASAAMARAEAALTDRYLAPGVAYITGHSKRSNMQFHDSCNGDVFSNDALNNDVHNDNIGSDIPPYNWKALVDSGLTLVVYMGAKHISFICSELIRNGLDRCTPLLVADRVEQDDETLTVTTVGGLTIQEISLKGPSIFIIGKVVDNASVANRLEELKLEVLNR